MKNILLLVKQTSLLQLKQRGIHTSKLLLASKVINVPSMGDSISEGTLVEIRKSIGDSVQVDDIVAILDTDKVIILCYSHIFLYNLYVIIRMQYVYIG